MTIEQIIQDKFGGLVASICQLEAQVAALTAENKRLTEQLATVKPADAEPHPE